MPQALFGLFGYTLTFCMLGNVSCSFLSSAYFLCKIYVSKDSFRNAIRVLNSLDPDQARRFAGSDLDPNALQRLSADNSSRKF